MPNYDFQCQACGTVTERSVPFEAAGRQRCSCSGKLTHLFSPPIGARAYQEHIALSPDTGEPVRISSKEQHAAFLDKHGLFKDGVNHLIGSQEHNSHSDHEIRKFNKELGRKHLEAARRQVFHDRNTGTGSFDPKELEARGIQIKG